MVGGVSVRLSPLFWLLNAATYTVWYLLAESMYGDLGALPALLLGCVSGATFTLAWKKHR